MKFEIKHSESDSIHYEDFESEDAAYEKYANEDVAISNVDKPIMIETKSKADDIMNVVDNQGSLGKLRFISRIQKLRVCRECKTEIEIGSACFSQSDYRTEKFFPEQTSVCMRCGNELYLSGTEIKNKDMMQKWLGKKQ